MLEQWEKKTQSGGGHHDKLEALRSATSEQLFDAKQNLHAVKDSDIGWWALDANNAVGLTGFKASHNWVDAFKR